MSRAATGDVVTIKPRNNVYTVLTIAAVVAEIVALIVLFMQHKTLFGTGLFS